MNKRRVLYTAFDLFPSPKGASIHILHFLRALVNNKYDVQLITPGDGVLPAEDNFEGARITRIASAAGNNFLDRAIQFGEAIMDHVAVETPYQVVHYRSIWGGLQLALAKNQYGYKTLFEVNGLPSIELKYHYPGIQGTVLLDKIREQELATLQGSDAIICPSRVTAAYLISLGVPEKRITVIPNGVSQQDFPQATLLPTEGHIPVILYIGTLADWQGLDILIKTMPLILAQQPIHLRIVGRGRSRQRKTLAKQISKAGLAEFVSLEEAVPHHEVAGLIAQADICVSPLGYNDRNVLQGCCPIKIIEYMAVGRPLVASNLPVVRELVREGQDGLLFTPNDPEDLACKILKILQDRNLAERLAENAANRAREQLTWHIAQKKLLKVYQHLEKPA